MEYLQDFTRYCNLPTLKNVHKTRQEWLKRDSVLPWNQLLADLPPIKGVKVDGSGPRVRIEKGEGLIRSEDQEKIRKTAERFKPWRKGPFELFGIEIDGEWRADLKWDRISGAVGSLQGQRILDIGCNNGYYLMRMAHCKPQLLLGFDPTLLYYYQYRLLTHWHQPANLHFELFGVEQVRHFENFFDSIFSMGIVYHRRHPLEQLSDIYQALRPSGQLLLETLIYPGEESVAFFPPDRYASMKNVWFIPTRNCLFNWLKRMLFTKIEFISESNTSAEEQRTTSWSSTASLADFLSPHDPSLTLEGHPAPRRLVVLARK